MKASPHGKTDMHRIELTALSMYFGI